MTASREGVLWEKPFEDMVIELGMKRYMHT